MKAAAVSGTSNALPKRVNVSGVSYRWVDANTYRKVEPKGKTYCMFYNKFGMLALLPACMGVCSDHRCWAEANTQSYLAASPHRKASARMEKSASSFTTRPRSPSVPRYGEVACALAPWQEWVRNCSDLSVPLHHQGHLGDEVNIGHEILWLERVLNRVAHSAPLAVPQGQVRWAVPAVAHAGSVQDAHVHVLCARAVRPRHRLRLPSRASGAGRARLRRLSQGILPSGGAVHKQAHVGLPKMGRHGRVPRGTYCRVPRGRSKSAFLARLVWACRFLKKCASGLSASIHRTPSLLWAIRAGGAVQATTRAAEVGSRRWRRERRRGGGRCGGAARVGCRGRGRAKRGGGARQQETSG